MDNKKNIEKRREAYRQLFHACSGIFIVVLLYFNLLAKWLFLIITLTAIVTYYFWKPGSLRIYDWLFGKMERNGEKAGDGALWYCLGCFFAVILFSKEIASAAIMILALGDSVSHYVGRFYGQIPHPFDRKKNVEGTIAGIVFAWFGTLFFVHWMIGFVTTVIVMNLEVIEWRIGKWKINDNLWMPVVAGFLMWIMQMIF